MNSSLYAHSMHGVQRSKDSVSNYYKHKILQYKVPETMKRTNDSNIDFDKISNQLNSIFSKTSSSNRAFRSYRSAIKTARRNINDFYVMEKNRICNVNRRSISNTKSKNATTSVYKSDNSRKIINQLSNTFKMPQKLSDTANITMLTTNRHDNISPFSRIRPSNSNQKNMK